ncbi:MAG TPA: Hsp20/alpha crystallin family protein [Acidobacteriota bacterium]|nr:Hsp20/alpha crystallin family protein [Acidobacteriota bacterium]
MSNLNWQPVADVYRIRNGWLIKVDLAGVRLEDVDLSTQGNCLTIQGVRRDLLKEELSSFYSLEISYNRFSRSIVLPVNLNQAQIRTDYRDGMLLVRIEMEASRNEPGRGKTDTHSTG